MVSGANEIPIGAKAMRRRPGRLSTTRNTCVFIELTSFAPKHRTKELTEFIISFGGNIIHDTPYIKNLGAYFDRTRSIEMK
jgi:hypothetical protein